MSIADSTAIRLSPEVFRLYRETIARHPPETFALLGGCLDDPRHVTEFRFCPPRRDARGRYDASRVHINIDAEFLNWIVDNEWVPNGKFLLGFWHSHPPGATRPSHGDPVTNEGDVAFFSSCLQHDDSPGRRWSTCLAPITTFRPDGTDAIHGWSLARGSTEPLPCPVVVEPQVADHAGPGSLKAALFALSVQRLEFSRDLLVRYAVETTAIARNTRLSWRDRRTIIRTLERLRENEIRDLIAGRHPLSRLLSLSGPEAP